MDATLAEGYIARPYRGREDHEMMATVLGAVRRATSDNEVPSAEQFDNTYSNFRAEDCVPTRDAVLVFTTEGEPVGYGRTMREVHEAGDVNWTCFPVLHPDHADEALFTSMIESMHRHLHTVELGDPTPSWYLTFAAHPGPGCLAAGPSAWLEAMGYEPIQFGATLVRPHLDDVPDLPLPDGIEIRPVQPAHLRQIWEVHQEAFRGQWDFHEPDEVEFQQFIDDPLRDESLWKIAWAGDDVVGQVKSYISAHENSVVGRLRGYTEYISTRAGWRGRGIAGALLCASLRELRLRGMTEAALGADVDNPSAFELYQRIGFQVTSYEAVYRRPIRSA